MDKVLSLLCDAVIDGRLSPHLHIHTNDTLAKRETDWSAFNWFWTHGGWSEINWLLIKFSFASHTNFSLVLFYLLVNLNAIRRQRERRKGKWVVLFCYPFGRNWNQMKSNVELKHRSGTSLTISFHQRSLFTNISLQIYLELILRDSNLPEMMKSGLNWILVAFRELLINNDWYSRLSKTLVVNVE